MASFPWSAWPKLVRFARKIDAELSAAEICAMFTMFRGFTTHLPGSSCVQYGIGIYPPLSSRNVGRLDLNCVEADLCNHLVSHFSEARRTSLSKVLY